jgi:hypothetical protein
MTRGGPHSRRMQCAGVSQRRPMAPVSFLRIAVVAVLLMTAAPPAALAQQSVADILSFLLTNRSIATADPVRDAQAATAAAKAISHFLLIELATLPSLSSSTGFTYRVDSNLGGAVVRSSDSFGPSFVERSLTAGALNPAFSLTYQETSFDRIDDRSLSDGTLLATASRLDGDLAPFDVETISMRLRTRVVTLATNVGVTDWIDVSAALPFVRLSLSGERVDTLRGQPFVQAAARAETSGLGDIALRVKYNVIRNRGSGVAVGAEAKLPTGTAKDLLGAGKASITPRVIGSVERRRISLHSELGYAFGGLSRELDYSGALSVVGSSRLTLSAEVLGRRLESAGRLTETVARHPILAHIETLRLTALSEATHRAAAVVGIKWNVATTWLVTASVMRPLTSAGLTAGIIPSIAAEYSLTR